MLHRNMLRHALRPDRTSLVRLRDGAPLTLRPLGPPDLVALKPWFQAVSPESRYLRFHGNFAALSDAQWRTLITVDGVARLGLGAWLGDEVVGIGHVIRNLDDETRAEIALLVSDGAQRRGIGTALFARLATDARGLGVERLVAHVLPSNQGMRRLLLRSGLGTLREQREGFELELTPRPRGLQLSRWLRRAFGWPVSGGAPWPGARR